ncbi:MAG: DUF1559 domain-containing protein [Isosphaeraceae bacterium]
MTLIEVVVVGLVVALSLLVILATLPRLREGARLAGCRDNLRRIGQAVTLYDGSQGGLPFVGSLSATDTPGPCALMLNVLGLPDFQAIDDLAKPRKPTLGPIPRAGRVPGFLCLSDPNASSPSHPSPISYRACAGDTIDGRNGAFAVGQRLSLETVDDGDGIGFTAAFSERLLGTGQDERIASSNYAITAGPPDLGGCPERPSRFWKGDAGSSWVEASWRSSLYHHAMVPNAPRSCVSEDGQFAFMGASSGHAEGVNVLILDGSVRTVRPSVAIAIWQALATTHSPNPTSERPIENVQEALPR